MFCIAQNPFPILGHMWLLTTGPLVGRTVFFAEHVWWQNCRCVLEDLHRHEELKWKFQDFQLLVIIMHMMIQLISSGKLRHERTVFTATLWFCCTFCYTRLSEGRSDATSLLPTRTWYSCGRGFRTSWEIALSRRSGWYSSWRRFDSWRRWRFQRSEVNGGPVEHEAKGPVDDILEIPDRDGCVAVVTPALPLGTRSSNLEVGVLAGASQPDKNLGAASRGATTKTLGGGRLPVQPTFSRWRLPAGCRKGSHPSVRKRCDRSFERYPPNHGLFERSRARWKRISIQPEIKKTSSPTWCARTDSVQSGHGSFKCDAAPAWGWFSASRRILHWAPTRKRT